MANWDAYWTYIKEGLAVRFSCIPLFLLITASSWLAYLTPSIKLLRTGAGLPFLSCPSPNGPFRYNQGIWLVTQSPLIYLLPSWPHGLTFPSPLPQLHTVDQLRVIFPLDYPGHPCLNSTINLLRQTQDQSCPSFIVYFSTQDPGMKLRLSGSVANVLSSLSHWVTSLAWTSF